MTRECSQIIVDNVMCALPLVEIPRAAHVKVIDEPFLCVDAIRRFVNICEASWHARSSPST